MQQVAISQKSVVLAYIKLLRPEQWVKNLFIFIPLFFEGHFFDIELLFKLGVAFVAFSAVCSAIYVLNDYRDIEADQAHPKKRERPLASGEVSKAVGLATMSLLAVAGLGVGLLLNIWFFVILLTYVGINVGYSFGLKHIGILDILLIASGFLLRTVSGGIVADVPVSQWLIIMIFLLALFLAIAKRRDDVVLGVDSGVLIRKSVKNYNLEFVNACMTMIAGIIVVAYLMYTISDEVVIRLGEHLVYTSVFVIAGLMRYLQITLVEKNSGSPTALLYKDSFIQITLAGWILSFFWLIYLG
ncbi:decaprenyl-phosphate phosphoribosyltransferase [Tunicatimonas pelagia]|uniref:decaprenyl-phosphate phosphoribosyltransferase n=1 Tax=Tunicatimonas pelagia TaxID=931531 RepID=UPI00266510F7|nr:decaprenyl-phosphate phosphoribosyltransferase [Tunicatimonas pelagia]WKN42946.1 decaprenyl-phosphate phosphoribosyltransferase [Tunicatimonas pelagia]